MIKSGVHCWSTHLAGERSIFYFDIFSVDRKNQMEANINFRDIVKNLDKIEIVYDRMEFKIKEINKDEIITSFVNGTFLEMSSCPVTCKNINIHLTPLEDIKERCFDWKTSNANIKKILPSLTIHLKTLYSLVDVEKHFFDKEPLEIKRDFSFIIDYCHLLSEYDNYTTFENLPQRTVWCILSNESPTVSLGLTMLSCLFTRCTFIILSEPRKAYIAKQFIQICLDSGVPAGAINLYIVENAQTSLPADAHFTYMGPNWLNMPLNKVAVLQHLDCCVVVVTEYGDIDSAIDIVLKNDHKNTPYVIRKIIIQENVKIQFEKRLKNLLKQNNIENISKKLLFYLEKNAIEYIPTKKKGKVFTYDQMINVNEFEDYIVLLQTYRTTNDLIGIIETNTFFGLSLWCDSISVAHEIMFKINVANIWLNGYVDLSYSHELRGNGYGDFGVFANHPANMDNYCFMPKIQDNQCDIHNASELLHQQLNFSMCIKKVNELRDKWAKYDNIKQIQIIRSAQSNCESLLETKKYESKVKLFKDKIIYSISSPKGLIFIDGRLNRFENKIFFSTLLGNGVIYLTYNKEDFSKIITHYDNGIPIFPIFHSDEIDYIKLAENLYSISLIVINDGGKSNGCPKTVKWNKFLQCLVNLSINVKTICTPFGESYGN